MNPICAVKHDQRMCALAHALMPKRLKESTVDRWVAKDCFHNIGHVCTPPCGIDDDLCAAGEPQARGTRIARSNDEFWYTRARTYREQADTRQMMDVLQGGRG